MVANIKKMETFTFTLNTRENRILLSIGGGATCRYNAYICNSFMLVWFSVRNLCVSYTYYSVTDGYA